MREYSARAGKCFTQQRTQSALKAEMDTADSPPLGRMEAILIIVLVKSIGNTHIETRARLFSEAQGVAGIQSKLAGAIELIGIAVERIKEFAAGQEIHA